MQTEVGVLRSGARFETSCWKQTVVLLHRALYDELKDTKKVRKPLLPLPRCALCCGRTAGPPNASAYAARSLTHSHPSLSLSLSLSSLSRLSLVSLSQLLMVSFMRFFLGAMLGLVWLNSCRPLDNPQIFVVQGVLFTIVNNAVLGTLGNTVLTFPMRRALLLREYKNGSFAIVPWCVECAAVMQMGTQWEPNGKRVCVQQRRLTHSRTLPLF